ncbi:MAG TPA: bifunctional riboflavin kinase/FAD synthetase, partial [Polyangiaceae bacterium]|nr:bifunctional riboflavin kinase/FAD synthetase [Polyangiaceae bacterium]
EPHPRSKSDAVTSSERAPSEAGAKGPSLVVIGNFDGVHRGHRAVIASALSLAKAHGLAPKVLTFHPHPSEVLGRGVRPVLTPVERKVELLQRLGAELEVVVAPFTLELSRMTPRDFVRHVLVEELVAKVVIVGENFRFGHGRAGDLHTLRELGAEFGFEARAEPLVGDELGIFSSTRAREALERGDLSGVLRCLGRPHALSGTVVHGAHRGRDLGFRTANLGEVREAIPPYGVYACLVDRLDGGNARALARGVMNLGVRPTVQAGYSAEVHLLDWEGDLYGATLRVHLVDRLRGEQRFPSLEALVEQIHRDASAARELLEGRAPDPAANGAWA